MLAVASMDTVWNSAGGLNEPAVPPVFPYWEVLHAEPNREQRSADLLNDKAGKTVYWPHYTAQLRCGSGRHVRARDRSVFPGVLLAPIGMLSGCDRDMLLDWARLRPMRLSRPLTCLEVEVIREIEGKLRFRETIKVNGLGIGQRVRFLNDLYAAFLGEGTVIKVAHNGRISVKIDGKLFGGKDTIVTPAAELEAM